MIIKYLKFNILSVHHVMLHYAVITLRDTVSYCTPCSDNSKLTYLL